MSKIITYIAPQDNEAKIHALISYALLGVGMFTAIPMLIGAIWAMIKKGDAAGSVYHSHYSNVIRTFWWGLFWAITGGILVYVLIGYAILGIAWLWACYRLLNGFAKIMADKPYPL